MALLSATLVASPLLAKDKKKIEPVTMQKRIDQSSPVNLNTDTVENELRNGSNKRSNPMFVDTQSKGEMIDDKTSESTNEREKGSGMATGKRTHKSVKDTEQLDNASTKELKFGTRISTEGQAHRATVAGGGDSEELQSSKGYLKIDDIKGESTRATEEVQPNRIEFKNAIAADLDGDSGDDGDTSSSDKASRKGYNYYKAQSNSASSKDADTTEEAKVGEEACSNLKDNERCVDGHVTVLK